MGAVFLLPSAMDTLPFDSGTETLSILKYSDADKNGGEGGTNYQRCHC